MQLEPFGKDTTMNEHLLENYRYHRRARFYRQRPAAAALKMAREDLAKGKRHYTQAFDAGPIYNPETEAFGHKHCRWVEDVSDLRKVGTLDEVLRANHRRSDYTGWHVDPDGHEVAIPAVYQLPSRKGRKLYAYGYDDWTNPNAAFLCFDLEPEDELEAARAADHLTERMAEDERAYQEAWQKGREYDDLGAEVAASRKRLLALFAELRQTKLSGAICQTLRETILAKVEEISEARRERAKLLDEWGSQPGFVE